MNPFRDLPHPSQGLKPMKEMRLQKPMDLVVIIQPSTALLEMLNPVVTCILNFRRKAFLHSTAVNISYKRTVIA